MKTKGIRYSISGITADVYQDGVQLHCGRAVESWPQRSFGTANTDEDGYPALLHATGYTEHRAVGETLGTFVERVGKREHKIIG